MALNLPTFYKRTGSAIVFAAIMLTGLLWNDWAFLVLICLIQALCLKEYFQLVKKIEPDTWWPKWLPLAVQIGSFLWILQLTIINLFYKTSVFTLEFIKYFYSATIVFICIIPVSLLLITVLSKKTAWRACLNCLGAIIYIVAPISLLVLLRSYHPFIPMIMILMIWTNDTMAYLVGSFIGKHSFSPISPNKTWEGVIGGIILTIIGSGACGYYFSTHIVHGAVDAILGCVMGLIVGITGTLGDLLESKLKRIAGVKDTGTLMPGHGGALDRFDSLLIVTPFVYCMVYIVAHF